MAGPSASCQGPRGAEKFNKHPDFTDERRLTVDALSPHLIMGDPAQCVEKLQRYHEEFGVDYVVMRFRMLTGPSFEAVSEQILRFGEEVAGPIHRKYPAPGHPALPLACRW
jgi:alkanesulfonate monooxygenase SsuD/methylene tetrahydromethanopterin reductase-like flavin-dependent oxidoreductase (luciferase family)